MSGESPRRSRAGAKLGLLVLAGLGLVVAWPWLRPEHGARREERLTGSTMGTTWMVKLILDPTRSWGDEDTARAARVVQETLDDVEARMSTYREESELSRFNASTETSPFRLSAETFEVFRLAREVSELTGGAFDVTVGPLVNAYGFGPDPAGGGVPEDEEVERLRERVGYRLLSLDPAASTVSKERPDVYCDLSAVAKGRAVDRVAAVLREKGLAEWLVEVGGEVRVLGLNRLNRPWRVATEEPVVGRREIHSVIELKDGSLATSGDYRNFRVRDGQRFSHTIDPRTGRPVTHDLAAVSVVHESCAWADALATGLLVLGPEAGPELARKHEIAALFLVRGTNGAIIEEMTPAYRELEPGPVSGGAGD